MYDSRDDVPEPQRFDLAPLFDSRDDWVEECDRVADDVDGFDLDRPVSTILDEFEALSARDHRLREYANLRADVATGDDDRAADRDRAQALHDDVMALRDAVERRVRERTDPADVAADADRESESISDRGSESIFDRESESISDRGSESVPERFERYVADVHRRRAHELDPAAADLLGTLDDVLDAPERTHRALVDRDFEAPVIDVDGEPVTLSRSERGRMQREGERDVRRRAFQAVRDAFRDRRETLATTLDAMARRNVALADARGYEDALAAALDGDDPYVACRPQPRLARDAYDALVDGVRSNPEPNRRLQAIRQDALGVDTLQPWDRNAVPIDGDPPRYDFADARDVVLDALAPLGDAYLSRVEALFDERRIDAFDHPGKTERGAGYATYAPDAGAFVLARWNGSLAHLFLLAHELGHAVHATFADDAQPHVTAGIPEPLAELPSKLHEVLLADHLLAVTADDERGAVAARAVRSIGSNLFYSARWATFTHRLHQRVADGDRLTADWLDATYGDLFAAFDPVVEVTDRLRAGWTTGLYAIPLYHHYPYILGTAGALAVADALDDRIEPADYVEFLETGSARAPAALLADLGVDATDERTVKDAVSRFDDYVEAFADATR